MADPVSSVAYAIEAALRSLDGDLASLLPTMTAIIAIIGVISATYHELIGRFPGGGGPEGIARAFGEGWAFVSLGALLVDFTLTVEVSCAAGASMITYAPELEPLRTPTHLALLCWSRGRLARQGRPGCIRDRDPGVHRALDMRNRVGRLRFGESASLFAAFQASSALLLLSAAASPIWPVRVS